MSYSPIHREVPEGWTTDPFYASFPIKGRWAKIAKRCGLVNPVGLMHDSPESGETMGLISAGGRYFFTDDMTWSIFEIIKPKTLDEILKMMFDGKERLIKTKRLEEVMTKEDLEEEKKEKEARLASLEQAMKENRIPGLGGNRLGGMFYVLYPSLITMLSP
ncbi:hypothetical protein DTO271D3_2942 [Paecilomyces variotii]|nr:hypothetical protein DTO271D3_2942 [Paecilomyces variotii]